MGRERRRHTRRPYAHHVLCYIDGWRLDAFTLDMSLGGTFLATDHAPRISLGALVGVVVNDEEPTSRRVYLFGTVVRVVGGEIPGLGVQWVRAASIDAVDPLVHVLGELFGLTAEQVRQRVTERSGRQRFVFTFDEAPAVPPEPPCADAGQLETPARRATDPQNPVPPARATEPQVVVDLEAVLDVRGVRISSRLTRLGARTLDLRSAYVPSGAVDALAVEYRLPVKNLDVPIRCTCRVQEGAALGEGVLSLVVDQIDEGRFPRAVEQYVKWACTRGTARA